MSKNRKKKTARHDEITSELLQKKDNKMGFYEIISHIYNKSYWKDEFKLSSIQGLHYEIEIEVILSYNYSIDFLLSIYKSKRIVNTDLITVMILEIKPFKSIKNISETIRQIKIYEKYILKSKGYVMDTNVDLIIVSDENPKKEWESLLKYAEVYFFNIENQQMNCFE